MSKQKLNNREEYLPYSPNLSEKQMLQWEAQVDEEIIAYLAAHKGDVYDDPLPTNQEDSH